jgi:hypothetical protein
MPNYIALLLTSFLSFFLVVLFPAKTLLYAPIVLGIPHIVGDIWLLIICKGKQPRRSQWALGALSVLFVLAVGLQLTVLAVPNYIVTALFVSLLFIPYFLANPQLSSWPLFLCALMLSFLLITDAMPIRGIVTHLHNVIAIIFLYVAMAQRGCSRKIFLLLFLLPLTAGAIVSALNKAVFFLPLRDITLEPFMALGLNASPSIASALLFSFGFLQLIHFATWIWFLPSWAGSLGTVLKKSRLVGVGGVAVGTAILLSIVAIFFSATYDPIVTRESYLTLVSFHGWVEFGWLLAQGVAILNHRGTLSLEELFSLQGENHV